MDEFVGVTGCHRKAAIRLLRQGQKSKIKVKRGRPRQYGNEVTLALKTAWEASDHICSKRLQPFLPEMVTILMRKGEMKVSVEVREQLIGLSASSIDRFCSPIANQKDTVPWAPPNQVVYSRVPSRFVLLLIGKRIVRAFWKRTWWLTAVTMWRVFSYIPCLP